MIPEVWRITWLSLQVSAGATLLSLLVGIPLGTLLALARFPGRGLVISLVNTGMGLPPVVVGLFVTILLWRNGALGCLELLYTPSAMVLAQFVIATPIVTGLTLAAIQQVPEAFRLQMLGLGASRTQMLGAAQGGAPADAGRGHGGLRRRDLRGGRLHDGGREYPGSTRVLTTATVLETGKGNFDIAIALSVILLLITFLVNWALTWIQQRRRA